MVKSLGEKEIDERELKIRAKSLSIREGGFANVMYSIGDSFITPFALFLQATTFQIGILSSFIGIVGPLAQLRSTHILENHDRKKAVVLFAFLQALIWLPILLLGFMFVKNILIDWLPIALIIFYGIYIAFGAIISPLWFSWMGDIIDEKEGKEFIVVDEKVISYKYDKIAFAEEVNGKLVYVAKEKMFYSLYEEKIR